MNKTKSGLTPELEALQRKVQLEQAENGLIDSMTIICIEIPGYTHEMLLDLSPMQFKEISNSLTRINKIRNKKQSTSSSKAAVGFGGR